MAASSRHNGFWYDHANDELKILVAGTETMKFDGTVASAPTAADGSTVDATYGNEERDVIQNLVTRQAEIVTALQNLGLMAS